MERKTTMKKDWFIKELEDSEYSAIRKFPRSGCIMCLVLTTPWEGQYYHTFSRDFDKRIYFKEIEEGEEIVLDEKIRNYIEREFERMEYELD